MPWYKSPTNTHSFSLSLNVSGGRNRLPVMIEGRLLYVREQIKKHGHIMLEFLARGMGLCPEYFIERVMDSEDSFFRVEQFFSPHHVGATNNALLAEVITESGVTFYLGRTGELFTDYHFPGTGLASVPIIARELVNPNGEQYAVCVFFNFRREVALGGLLTAGQFYDEQFRVTPSLQS